MRRKVSVLQLHQDGKFLYLVRLSSSIAMSVMVVMMVMLLEVLRSSAQHDLRRLVAAAAQPGNLGQGRSSVPVLGQLNHLLHLAASLL